MRINQITPDYSCSEQITAEQLEDLHRRGIQSLICFRPDGEQAGQIEFDELTKAATGLGMVCYHLPYDAQDITPELLVRLHEVIESAPKPAHAFCKSGRRAALPVAFSKLKSGASFDEVVDEFKAHGFDVTVLQTHLQE